MSDECKLSLAVQYASDAKNIPTRAQLRRWVKAALRHDVQIALRIVDEEEGRELNRGYRGKDYATNVLTFVYDDEAQPRRGGVEPAGAGGAAGRLLPQAAGFASNVLQPPLYGDIVICAPVVAREAHEQNKDLHAHYAHLVVHSMLHLQGHEHEDEQEAAEMEKLETAILAKLGYADPYAVISETK